MATTMSASAAVLRIGIALSDPALRCQWALCDGDREALTGSGPPDELPDHDGVIEVILAARDVLITRCQLPAAARRQSGALLAYAVEDATAGAPEENQVTWLGADAAGINTLAVMDKAALLRWHAALAEAGIRRFTLCCETLLLPWSPGGWSVAWNGADGFVRTAEAEGGASDCGDRNTPPLSIELMLAESRQDNSAPAFITLYTSKAEALPNLEAWSETLGLTVKSGGHWHWSDSAGTAGPALVQQRERFQMLAGLPGKLRPALLLLALALVLHGVALAYDQRRLGSEQRELRAQMEARFRQLFPDAVAVVDPLLQLRRQLATARQLGGIADSSDFLPLLEQLALATRELPAGLVRTVSWEAGRMTVEFTGITDSDVSALLDRLRQAGLRADLAPASADSNTLILNIQAT